MKLIIEIPIDLLERTKSGDYNFGDDLARNEVIVNGTPYNPSGDLISREALKDITYINKGNFNTVEGIREWIDNAPSVEPKIEIVPVCKVTFDKEQLQEIVDKAINEMQWIPITMRPIEEDEKIDFPDATFMFDCHMPENGEEILITTKYGVEFDTCYNDDGYYLDSNKSWDEVLAWMPLPEAYKKGGAEE